MAQQMPSSESKAYLRATLRVEPHADAGCQIAKDAERTGGITQSLTPGDDCECATSQECCAEVKDESDASSRFVSQCTDAYCICPVFTEHDCVASIDAYEQGEFVVSVSIPGRSELTAVIDGLRDAGASVRLHRITEVGGDQVSRRLEIETHSITDKQREAIETAIEAGYYETPRRADLSELAEELGVSRSAVSQRLTAVESKLVVELFEAQGGAASR